MSKRAAIIKVGLAAFCAAQVDLGLLGASEGVASMLPVACPQAGKAVTQTVVQKRREASVTAFVSCLATKKGLPCSWQLQLGKGHLRMCPGHPELALQTETPRAPDVAEAF